ncbi:MAG: hypothetical protein ABI779_14845 [Acidobacteriota bacterium]
MTLSPLAFFLGGYDLEMVTIRELLADMPGVRVIDRKLSWGAKASAYAEEITEALARGETAVLVELENDLGLELGQVINLDHHGASAGAEASTSLEQVFALLALPPSHWTRWHALVAANDRGHIPAMRELGASDAEVARVRTADRAAQGISAEQERDAEAAIAGAEVVAGGDLVIVRLPHARTAAVVDRLVMQPAPPENVLVLAPQEVNFFGRGDLVHALDARFPGGWKGGALPSRGFWGRSGDGAEVSAFVREELHQTSRTVAR